MPSQTIKASDGTELDSTVVNLARAVRKKESNGNYTQKGGSGEYGAYQWMPGNYEAAAKKYGIDPADKSPIAQDKVAYYQMLDDKKKGLSPEQIAAKWNSGSPTGWEKKVGVNKAGVKYDVPAYVADVMKNFQDEKLAAQGAGLSPRKGGLALAPVAEAATIDSMPQDQQQYDDTEKMLMKAAGVTSPDGGSDKPYTLNDIFNDFSVGVAKAELRTAKNIGKILNPSILGGAVPVLSIFSPILSATGIGNKSVTDMVESTKFGKKLLADENLANKNTAEKVGGIVENTAEFMAPMKLIKGGQLAINTLIKGVGFLPSVGRVLGRAGVEAAGGAGVSLAQTGDPTEAAKTGALFGGLKGITGTVGEAAKALKLPERIYSSIFKNSYKDVVQELKTAGAAAFKKSNPEEFAALSEAGVIKVGKNGVINVNETLAKQALDKGLKGSLKNMANQTVAGLYRSEAKVREAAKNATELVNVSEKQYQTVLRQIQADYKDVGFGEFSQKAKVLADAIKQGKGKVSAESAIAIRRLLDGLRTQASYNAPSQRLSLGQQNLKFLANTLRGRVNKIPGMSKVMEDYSFHIDALEHIGREAARAGNRQIISLLDAIFFGGGAVSAVPAVGAGLGLARRILTVPTSATRIAQGIQNSGTLSKTGAAIKGLITSLRPFQEGQQ